MTFLWDEDLNVPHAIIRLNLSSTLWVLRIAFRSLHSTLLILRTIKIQLVFHVHVLQAL